MLIDVFSYPEFRPLVTGLAFDDFRRDNSEGFAPEDWNDCRAAIEQGRLFIGGGGASGGFLITAAMLASVDAYLMASDFVARLRFAGNVGDDNWQAMRAKNAEYARDGKTSVCASHDFCDANMPMADAFRAVMGRDIFGEDGEIGEADSKLWGEAWNLATRLALTA